MLSIFSSVSWPSVYLLWKMSGHILWLLFKWIICYQVLSCISSLYILDTNLFLDISSVSIFSHSVGCLFVLLIVSLNVQEIFILMQSQQFIFAFLSLASEDICRKMFAMVSVRDSIACALFQDFYDFRSHIQIFNPFWVY